MKVEVWKSEHTGELFEDEADFIAHLNGLRAAEASELARRLESLVSPERLKALQDQPFLHATSMDDLFARIIDCYPMVARLMVELELLHPSADLRRLVRIQEPASEGDERIVLGPIGDVLAEFGGDLPDTTLGFCAKRAFVFEGPDSEGLVDEMVKAFPKLRAGCGLGEGEARVSFGDGIAYATSFLCIRLDDTPVLKALYDEYSDAWKCEGEALDGEHKELFETLLANDTTYQTIAGELRSLSTLIDQLQNWREGRVYALLGAKDRVKYEAVESIPRLKFLETMRKTVCL
jgi:hypothetical protein